MDLFIRLLGVLGDGIVVAELAELASPTLIPKLIVLLLLCGPSPTSRSIEVKLSNVELDASTGEL